MQTGGTRIERISSATQAAALDYLSQNPYANVLIAYVILFDSTPATRNRILLAVDNDAVRGVAYFGHQLALSADDRAVEAFAEHARRGRGERMIIGPRSTVQRFWRLVRDRRPVPRIVRERQLVMMVDRSGLRSYQPSVIVRHARAAEWALVAESSAQMIEQELAYDPRRTSSAFIPNLRSMVERDHWWVGERHGELCFFCSIGPWCRQTIQLQGVWTPPELRGRGLATASLSAICDRLLDVSPTVSLIVNDFNARAIALYRRVGFEHAGDYQTILF